MAIKSDNVLTEKETAIKCWQKIEDTIQSWDFDKKCKNFEGNCVFGKKEKSICLKCSFSEYGAEFIKINIVESLKLYALKKISKNFKISYSNNCILCQYFLACYKCPLGTCSRKIDKNAPYAKIVNFFEQSGSVSKEEAVIACEKIINAIKDNIPDDFTATAIR